MRRLAEPRQSAPVEHWIAERWAPAPPTVLITGEIGPLSVANVRADLERHRHAPELRVLISSQGGRISSARDIAALIWPERKRCVARVVDRCESAAIEVLLSCNDREAIDGSSFLIHEAEIDIADADPARRWTHARHAAVAAGLKLSDARFTLLCAERCDQPVERFEQLMRHDTRLSAVEAMALGLVHRVVRC